MTHTAKPKTFKDERGERERESERKLKRERERLKKRRRGSERTKYRHEEGQISSEIYVQVRTSAARYQKQNLNGWILKIPALSRHQVLRPSSSELPADSKLLAFGKAELNTCPRAPGSGIYRATAGRSDGHGIAGAHGGLPSSSGQGGLLEAAVGAKKRP